IISPSVFDKGLLAFIGIAFAGWVVYSVIELGRDLHRQTQLSHLDRDPAWVDASHSAASCEARQKRVEQLYKALLSNKHVQLRIIVPWLAMSVWAAFLQAMPLPNAKTTLLVRILSLGVSFLVLAIMAGVIAFAGGGCESYRELRVGDELYEWSVK